MVLFGYTYLHRRVYIYIGGNVSIRASAEIFSTGGNILSDAGLVAVKNNNLCMILYVTCGTPYRVLCLYYKPHGTEESTTS